MANNNEALGNGGNPTGIPYPPTGNFRAEAYNSEVREAILVSGVPKEGNVILTSILRKEYGYLIDEKGELRGRSDDLNPATGSRYPFLLSKEKKRITMPLPEKILKDYALLPKWTGFYKDLDDFCTKMLSFWSWDRKRKGKEKVKEAKRFIRESKTAQSANVETQNFLPIPSGSGATMASGSTNNKKVSNSIIRGGILASKKLPDLILLPKAKFPTKYPEGIEGDKIKLACENMPREYRYCESIVEQTKSLTNQELLNFWKDILITNESLSLQEFEHQAESVVDRYTPDSQGFFHTNKRAKGKSLTPGKPGDDQPITSRSGGTKRSASSDQPGKGKFVPKNREILKDLSEEQKKLVIHIRPKRESTQKVFTDTDWKNICDTIFGAMMLKEDANLYGDVMVKAPKLDKKGQGFILCKDQDGLNWLLNLANEALGSAECYQGNYSPRANLRVQLHAVHGGDPVTLLKRSLELTGISCRYPEEISLSKLTTISDNGRVADFNLNKKDLDEISTFRELTQRNTLNLFAPIYYYILLPNGKEDNWEPKGKKKEVTTPMEMTSNVNDRENSPDLTLVADIVNIDLNDDKDDKNGQTENEEVSEESSGSSSSDEEKMEEEEDKDSSNPLHPSKKARPFSSDWSKDDPLKLQDLNKNRYVTANYPLHNKNNIINNKRAIKEPLFFTAKKLKFKQATQEKEICFLSFSRMAPENERSPESSYDHGDVVNLSLEPKSPESERESGANPSLRPKISTELSRNQNGSGNSLKHQISYNATKSKDSNVINDNNHQILLNTTESKDFNVINHTKNNEKFPRLNLDSGTRTNLSSRPNIGDDEQETPKLRKSNRTGRGRKDCHKTCSGCTTFNHITPSSNLPKKDRKPTQKTSERYIKKSFLKILNSVTQSPRIDNISVSYSPDTKVQIKRKFEMFEGSAKNEASDEASKADPENNTKNNSTLEDKSQGQSKNLNNKGKKTKPTPKTP